MESIRPSPGIRSPRAAIRMPSGPSRTAVPSRTSTTVHPGMVVGLVSGAGAKGCLIAIAGPDGLVVTCEAANGRAPDVAVLGMLPTKAGAVVCSEVDTIFRAPSILPPDLVSEARGEGAAFWVIGLTPNMLANAGQFSPPAHPNPKLATSAIVNSRAVRARKPYGSRSTSTSSRSWPKISHRLAGCLGSWPPTTFPDRMFPRVLGSWSCMMRPTFDHPMMAV